MSSKTIGVISDTHGLIRPEVFIAFKGCDLIIHAGDIGSRDVIEKLSTIAPVIAVRGNTDAGSYVSNYNNSEVVEIENVLIYVLHDLNKLNIEPKTAGFKVVISGHTHNPCQEIREGVIYLNPGSAGPRRFNLPIHVSVLEINGDFKDGKNIYVRNIDLLNI